MGGGAWPFLVGGVICLVNSDNERDSCLVNSDNELYSVLLNRSNLVVGLEFLLRGGEISRVESN